MNSFRSNFLSMASQTFLLLQLLETTPVTNWENVGENMWKLEGSNVINSEEGMVGNANETLIASPWAWRRPPGSVPWKQEKRRRTIGAGAFRPSSERPEHPTPTQEQYLVDDGASIIRGLFLDTEETPQQQLMPVHFGDKQVAIIPACWKNLPTKKYHYLTGQLFTQAPHDLKEMQIASFKDRIRLLHDVAMSTILVGGLSIDASASTRDWQQGENMLRVAQKELRHRLRRLTDRPNAYGIVPWSALCILFQQQDRSLRHTNKPSVNHAPSARPTTTTRRASFFGAQRKRDPTSSGFFSNARSFRQKV